MSKLIQCPGCGKKASISQFIPDSDSVQDFLSAPLDSNGNPINTASLSEAKSYICPWCGTKMQVIDDEPKKATSRKKSAPRKKATPPPPPKPVAPIDTPVSPIITDTKEDQSSESGCGCFSIIFTIVIIGLLIWGICHCFTKCTSDTDDDLTSITEVLSDDKSEAATELEKFLNTYYENITVDVNDCNSESNYTKYDYISNVAEKKYDCIVDDASKTYDKIAEKADNEYNKIAKAAEREYDKVCANAQKEYEKVCDSTDDYDKRNSASQKYNDTRSKAYHIYDEIKSKAYQKYEDIKSKAYQKYDEVQTKAFNEYDSITTNAFDKYINN